MDRLLWMFKRKRNLFHSSVNWFFLGERGVGVSVDVSKLSDAEKKRKEVKHGQIIINTCIIKGYSSMDLLLWISYIKGYVPKSRFRRIHIRAYFAGSVPTGLER